MPSLLELFRIDTQVDLDANDSQVASEEGPFGNMTSNQFIVLLELKKPEHATLIRQAAKQAREDIEEGKEKDVDDVSLAVDWMTVELGLAVLPHLDVQGYVLAQTNPSTAHSTEDTVIHAQRLVRLYDRSGIPSPRVCIKIPATLAGLRACQVLNENYDIRTLSTVVFCVEQSLAAAEYAGSVYTSPYVNPLYVHFEPERHIKSEKPLRDLQGLKVTMEVQRQLRSRNLATQVIGASLVTLEETVSLSGCDRVTLSPTMLEKLKNQEDTAYFQAIRAESLAMSSTEYISDDEIPPDMHYPLEEPATDLKRALARPEVDEFIKDALYHFDNAEKALRDLASAALKALA